MWTLSMVYFPLYFIYRSVLLLGVCVCVRARTHASIFYVTGETEVLCMCLLTDLDDSQEYGCLLWGRGKCVHWWKCASKLLLRWHKSTERYFMCIKSVGMYVNAAFDFAFAVIQDIFQPYCCKWSRTQQKRFFIKRDMATKYKKDKIAKVIWTHIQKTF